MLDPSASQCLITCAPKHSRTQTNTCQYRYRYKYFFVVLLSFRFLHMQPTNHIAFELITRSIFTVLKWIFSLFKNKPDPESEPIAGLYEVIIYSSPDDKKKNRGFCFLEYESHKAASLAKRRLGTGRIKVRPNLQYIHSDKLANMKRDLSTGLGMWYNSRLGRSTGGAGWANNVQG